MCILAYRSFTQCNSLQQQLCFILEISVALNIAELYSIFKQLKLTCFLKGISSRKRGWTNLRVSAQIWVVEGKEHHPEKCNSFAHCYYSSITEDITKKLQRLHQIGQFKPTNILKFKGTLKTVYQETFISVIEDTPGIGKKLPIVFTIVKITHDKKTLKGQLFEQKHITTKKMGNIAMRNHFILISPHPAFS